MKSIIILENIRSAYNVGNIIRTADALGRDVAYAGYTPTPANQPKVMKTSLGAEESVGGREFLSTALAIDALRAEGYHIIAAELSDSAIALDIFSQNYDRKKPLAVVFGNEVVGVESDTLQQVDDVVFVPMKGIKESLNVGQTAAIFMRQLT